MLKTSPKATLSISKEQQFLQNCGLISGQVHML